MRRCPVRTFLRRFTACAASLAAASVAVAQPLPGAESVTLRELALIWARGEYRSPVICHLGGTPRRGLRRVLIAPGKRGRATPVDRLSFFDLEVPPDTHCFTELRSETPNVVGVVLLGVRGRHRTDTATRDFRDLLRREGGFRFEIPQGRLRIGPAGAAREDLDEVDFSGGEARLQLVERASDLARTLRDFGNRRRLLLSLEAPDGTRLELPLVQFDSR